MIHFVDTPTDWSALFGPLTTAGSDAFAAALPIGLPIVVLFVGLGVILKATGKLGVKR